MDRVEVAVLDACINAECRVGADGVVDASAEDFGERRDGATIAVLAVGSGGIEPGTVQSAFADEGLNRPALAMTGHLNPPEHAVVLCMDQKAAIQALDRLILSCRFHAAALNGTVSSTTAT